MTYQMNASDMDPKWIEDMWAKFPCVRVVDDNGVENGNIRTGPVRGSYMQHILVRAPLKQMPNGQSMGGKFSATALFPPAANIDLLKQVATETALSRWPNAGQVGGPTLHTPFRRQDEKANQEGYTPGGIFITATADQRAPYAVNAQGAPIVDQAQIISGAWYFFILRPFTFDATMKKGVSFGLQGIMKIADDKNLGGGGGGDPRADFAGVSIDTSSQAAAVNPSSLF